MNWLIEAKRPTLTVLLICAVIYAAFAAVLPWVGRSFVPRPMPPEPRLQLHRFERIEGFAFRVGADSLKQYEDSDADAQRSPVVLYEDDKPIGPAHSRHHDIEYVGRGRYSHFKEFGILMSTSDNSDPNRNGRLYWVGLPKK